MSENCDSFEDKEFEEFLNSMSGKMPKSRPTFITPDGFEVDVMRRMDSGYTEDMNRIPCFCEPFHGIPLQLQLFIMSDGSLKFRSWTWKGHDPLYNNCYLHVDEDELTCWGIKKDFHPTQAQKEAVAGLLSGRNTWEGLRLAPGHTLQKVVGGLTVEDIEAEEGRTGKKMTFA